ncbi:hypothetical protein ACFX15_025649 [Malus domestica]
MSPMRQICDLWTFDNWKRHKQTYLCLMPKAMCNCKFAKMPTQAKSRTIFSSSGGTLRDPALVTRLYLPEAVLNIPPNPSMKEARKEAEAVMFGAIDEPFAKTAVKPKDIGIFLPWLSIITSFEGT